MASESFHIPEIFIYRQSSDALTAINHIRSGADKTSKKVPDNSPPLDLDSASGRHSTAVRSISSQCLIVML